MTFLLLYSTTIYAATGVDSVTVKIDSTTISPATSGGNTYWIDKGVNPTVEATAKQGYIIKSGIGSTGVVNAAKTVNISSALATDYAVKFSSDSDFTLSVSKPGWDGTLEYTLDNGLTWTTWKGSELSGTATQPIYIRGTGNSIITGNNRNGQYKWTFTGKHCTGNIETLLDYQTVAKGQHPVMGKYCYAAMFYDCTSLVTPPELPATTLKFSCYNYMFYGCTSLTVAPELPATTLVGWCYDNMFEGCTSLTTAPSLPATTLAESCYYEMFNGCTSLTTAPSLPATTLADWCYYGMFRGCTLLTTASSLPATTLTYNCYARMFNGCTSLTTAPSLPATTLAESCYYEMFNGCTSLTTAPKLPATTLAKSCYQFMFFECTSLKLSTTKTWTYRYEYRIPTTDTGTTATEALNLMFGLTGGTFKGTPEINTTYYIDHALV